MRSERRITLRGDSEFKIESLKFGEPTTATGSLAPWDLLDTVNDLLVPRAFAAADTSGPGVFLHTWDSTNEIELPAGAITVEQGQFVFMAYSATEPVFLPNRAAAGSARFSHDIRAA